jgi:hypothetical protein
MLRIDPDIKFTTTVRINLVALQATFDIECLLLDTETLHEHQQAQAEGKMTAAEFVDTWLTGWPDGQVAAADGTPLKYSPAAVAGLLRTPGALIAMIQAFYKGYDEATEGNSAPLPAGS